MSETAEKLFKTTQKQLENTSKTDQKQTKTIQKQLKNKLETDQKQIKNISETTQKQFKNRLEIGPSKNRGLRNRGLPEIEAFQKQGGPSKMRNRDLPKQ